MDKKRDYSKLPVWARNYISKLESDIKSLEDDIRKIGAKESNVSFLIRYDAPRVYIPPNARILFDLGEGSTITAMIKTINGKSVLYVNGSFELLVLPEAANAINIFCDRTF